MPPVSYGHTSQVTATDPGCSLKHLEMAVRASKLQKEQSRNEILSVRFQCLEILWHAFQSLELARVDWAWQRWVIRVEKKYAAADESELLLLQGQVNQMAYFHEESNLMRAFCKWTLLTSRSAAARARSLR